jgi:hypothetical protein
MQIKDTEILKLLQRQNELLAQTIAICTKVLEFIDKQTCVEHQGDREPPVAGVERIEKIEEQRSKNANEQDE